MAVTGCVPQCGSMLGWLVRSASSSSSWFYSLTLPIPGTSRGWRRWRKETLAVGMQVRRKEIGSNMFLHFLIIYTFWKLCVGVYQTFAYNKLSRVFPALLSVTALNYLLSLVSLVLFYIYYTHTDGCTENKVFISLNLLLCIAASVLSILPQIQVQTLSYKQNITL